MQVFSEKDPEEVVELKSINTPRAANNQAVTYPKKVSKKLCDRNKEFAYVVNGGVDQFQNSLQK